MIRIEIAGETHEIPEKDVKVWRVDRSGNATRLDVQHEEQKPDFSDIVERRKNRFRHG